MSILVSTDKRFENLIDSLKKLIQDNPTNNSRLCRDPLILPCFICKFDNKNGVSGSFNSIAQLKKHISFCHKPLSIDEKKRLDDYLVLLEGLSILVASFPDGSYKILIDLIKYLLEIGGLHK